MKHAFSYTIDQQAMKVSLSHFYDMRASYARYLRPILGVIFILFGANFLINAPDSLYLGLTSLFLGVLFLLQKKLFVWRSIKAAKQGRNFPMLIKASADSDGLEYSASDMDSKTSWSHYIDFRLYPDEGLILFPQKNLHIWIPAKAQFTEGDWKSFLQLAISSLERKI